MITLVLSSSVSLSLPSPIIIIHNTFQLKLLVFEFVQKYGKICCLVAKCKRWPWTGRFDDLAASMAQPNSTIGGLSEPLQRCNCLTPPCTPPLKNSTIGKFTSTQASPLSRCGGEAVADAWRATLTVIKAVPPGILDLPCIYHQFKYPIFSEGGNFRYGV
jgi:hypothetical protein